MRLTSYCTTNLEFLLGRELCKPRLCPLGNTLLIPDISHTRLLHHLRSPGLEFRSPLVKKGTDFRAHDAVLRLAQCQKSKHKGAGQDLCTYLAG